MLALAVLMIAQALWSVHLNRRFYREHAPFFDSCSYTRQLVEVSSVTRTQGVMAGIRQAVSGNVALPFLEMALLAGAVEPARDLGVWLQWVWLLALAISLFFYFTRWRGVAPWLAVALTIPFVSFSRLYDWNGGLQDFRMDLSLYIFYGLTAVWWLITYESDRPAPWLIAGVAAALACLARATAPVYLAAALGPILIVRLRNGAERGRVIAGSVIMAAPVALAAIGFLIYNYSYLHFYYAEWSPDANARLPLYRSALHFVFAGTHLGISMAAAAAVALILNVLARRELLPRGLDWKLVWLAAAPPAFLMLSGAGMNGFVSMPAVFGMLMFCIAPFAGRRPLPQWALAGGLLLTAASFDSAIAVTRPQPLRGTTETRMTALRTLLDRMIADARANGRQRAAYLLASSGELQSCALVNTLQYEYRDLGAPQLYFPEELGFQATDPFLWNRFVPGTSDSERTANLVKTAMEQGDYILLPTAPTLDWLVANRGYLYINHKTSEIQKRLLDTGRWAPLGDPVAFTPHESYVLFARR